MPSRSLHSLTDVIQAVRQLDDTVTKFSMKAVDFHGRRIKNAAASEDANDYVIQRELTDSVGEVTAALTLLITRLTNVLATRGSEAFFNKGNVIIGPGKLGLFSELGGVSFISQGVGDPTGVILGDLGDLYINRSGGAGTTLYVKETGVDTTAGWVGK